LFTHTHLRQAAAASRHTKNDMRQAASASRKCVWALSFLSSHHHQPGSIYSWMKASLSFLHFSQSIILYCHIHPSSWSFTHGWGSWPLFNFAIQLYCWVFSYFFIKYEDWNLCSSLYYYNVVIIIVNTVWWANLNNSCKANV
jgi:hypothetical protein